MEERRHELHPEPPDGVERRHCSDELCMKSRTDWVEKEVMPKIMDAIWKAVWKSIAIAVGACVAAVFFIVKAEISNHNQTAILTYEDKNHHSEDIKRIETKFDNFINFYTIGSERILAAQDRLLAEVQGLKDRAVKR